MTKITHSLNLKIRILLALWNLTDTQGEVRKNELITTVQRGNEKSNFQGVLNQLEREGAIAFITQNRLIKVILTPTGLNLLQSGLQNPEFNFGTKQIPDKEVSALLKWLRYTQQQINQKTDIKIINSYHQFLQQALTVYDQLNQDYNLDDLVPIYKIRREMANSISRTQFNQWLLEMQKEGIFQLQGGSVENSTPDKIEDSITTPLGGLRCYVKRLK
jgi:hypothetical protein